MRVSTKGRYAVRAMLDLALHSGHGPVARERIADRTGISALYLAQLFSRLVKDGLVTSIKGPGGGYVLAQKAADLRVGDIMRAVEEPLAPASCIRPDAGGACSRAPHCVTHLLWARIGRQIEETLDDVSLAELCRQARELSGGGRDAPLPHTFSEDAPS